MTYSVVRISAIALGVATLVSLSPLSTASADTSAPSGTASTPSEAVSPIGATSATSGVTPGQHRAVTPVRRHYAHQYTRHYHTVWRGGRRYVYYGHNPIAAATAGVVGGVADLASLAAYPVYCFPRYGSCPVYLPY
jgi:hypothetical protein